jgi:hypothetical protein
MNDAKADGSPLLARLKAWNKAQDKVLKAQKVRKVQMQKAMDDEEEEVATSEEKAKREAREAESQLARLVYDNAVWAQRKLEREAQEEERQQKVKHGGTVAGLSMDVVQVEEFWRSSPDHLRRIAKEILDGQHDQPLPNTTGRPIEEVRATAAAYILTTVTADPAKSPGLLSSAELNTGTIKHESQEARDREWAAAIKAQDEAWDKAHEGQDKAPEKVQETQKPLKERKEEQERKREKGERWLFFWFAFGFWACQFFAFWAVGSEWGGLLGMVFWGIGFFFIAIGA